MEDDVDDVDDNDSEDLVADECARLTATEKEQENTLPVWNINEDGESDEDGNVDEEPRCDKDVEEVRIEKDVRRKAEEKKGKPKSVVLDEPCAVLDDVDDEDVVTISQLPQGEPALGVLGYVWGRSGCFGETPNPDPVLQQRSDCYGQPKIKGD